MRFWTLLLALGLLALGLAAHANADELKLNSKVDAVTVFPRGAEVIRTVRSEVPSGEHIVLLSDLPAGTDVNSIRVEGKATGTLEIGTVDAKRVQVLRKDSEAEKTERRRLEDAIEQERDRLDALNAEIETKNLQKRYIENLAGLPSVQPSPASGRQQNQQDWAQLLNLIGTSLADVQRSILTQRLKVRETKRKIKDLEKQLAALAPRQEQRTQVRISVSAAEALTADLTVRYHVRNARWLPLYDARLETGSRNVPSKLALTRRASIAQWTGETWQDVSVALSTARPSGRSSAPEIRPITVDFARPRPKPMAAAPAEAEARKGRRVRVAKESARSAAPSGGLLSTFNQAATERDAKVDNTGYQAVFEVPGKISVDNTGTAKRVKIATMTMEPSLVVRAVPKFDGRAYLYAKLSLPKTEAPLLRGQVMLFRDQTFVGKGRLPQLAGGEMHELGFGADDAVRIKYAKIGETRGESGLIS
ncbi:MAG: mucoidy inhibitor MuiA family protein, partial [Hyphomicrobiaceae bacterium]